MEKIGPWSRDIAQVTVRGITHICEITKNHELYDVVIDKDGGKNNRFICDYIANDNIAIKQWEKFIADILGVKNAKNDK